MQIPDEQFDIVVPFTFGPSLVAALFRNKLGASVVIWNHRGGYDDAGVDYSPFLIDQIRKERPVFVANSRAGGLFLRDRFKLSPSSVHIVNNAFIPESGSFPKQDNIFRSQSDDCQLVQVANFFPQKDFDTVLTAMKLLKESNMLCHMHLAGGFLRDDQECAFSKQVQEMGLSRLVTYHGRLDHSGVQALLERAHIGILSSKSEGCPNSVMEYMYWGLPVVGTDIPGIHDLVSESNADYLFSVGNAMQLKVMVERLAGDAKLRTQLGQENQRRLAEMFNPETVFSHWQRVFGVDASII